MKFFKALAYLIRTLLESPRKVLLLCSFFASTYVLFNGNLLRLWSLQRDEQHLTAEISRIQKESTFLEKLIRQARDPAFIQRQARDRLDLAEEQDLVFVFSE